MKRFRLMKQMHYCTTSSKITTLLFVFMTLFYWTSRAQSYCIPTFSYGCSNGHMIDDFKLAGEYGTTIIDLGTGCSSGAYDDRTSQGIVELLPGEHYYAKVVSGSTGTEYAALWIDANDDYTFQNSERYGVSTDAVSSNQGGSYVQGDSIDIYIPISAPTGIHRMRVMVGWNGVTTDSTDYSPCNNGSNPRTYGEVHDYKIYILPPPTCPKPRKLSADLITENAAHISWVPDGSEQKWAIIYGANGFILGNAGDTVLVNNNPEKTLQNLTDDKSYDVYVKAICGPGDTSDIVGPITFKTQCIATDVPFYQDFESINLPAVPDCSSQQTGNGNEWETYDIANSSTPGFTNQVLYHEKINNGKDADAWYFTQGINLTAGTNYQISYKYGNYSFYAESMEVTYGIYADSSQQNNQLAVYTQIVAGEAVGDTISFTVNNSGVYYFGFHATSGQNGFHLFVDDIEIKASCPKPSNIKVNNIGEHHADVSWDAGGSESFWKVYYGPHNFTIGQGGSFMYTSTNSIQLQNLNDDTKYDVYVAAICDTLSNDVSAPAGPKTFKTNKDLGVEEQNFKNFVYYPNPVQDNLNLEAGQQIKHILVYNMLGQKVIDVQPEETKVQLRTGNLEQGIYFMKVNIQGKIKTYKLIKE